VVHHPFFARWIYPRVLAAAERRGATAHRKELLAGLSGRVVEIGAGAGTNFRHYPASVVEIVATEPEDHFRSQAIRSATTAPAPVRVIDAVAEVLPLDDSSVDAAVSSLVLCSVADPARALAELFRVIRPGGQLRFYEHVRGSSPGLARLQRIVDKTFWPTLAGGCHTSRRTAAAIEEAGFAVERRREFMFRPCALSAPAAPHVIGQARRP